MQNSLEALVSQHLSLQNQFKHAEECFSEYLQMALYSNLDVSEPIIPSVSLRDTSKNPIILFLDNSSSDGQIFQKLYFSLIKRLNDITEEKRFTIVVIDRKGNLESFINLLNILRMIPLRYVEKMRIVVATERLINREELKQHPFQSYISSITVTINSLLKLKEIGMEAVIPALKKQGIADLSYKKQKGAMGYRGNYVDRNRQGTLKIDEILETRRHPTLASYELENGVPKVLIELIGNLRSKLDTAGIFRISPSVEEEQPEILSLDLENLEDLRKISNPHTVSSLIKKIFSRLEPPLFSYELYQFITMEQFQGESGLYLILSMLNKLPEANYESLKYLSTFILDDLLKHSQTNKMKSATLAVILAPVFLRSFNPSHDDLKHMSKMILIVKRIIDNCHFLFQDIKQQQMVVQEKPPQQTKPPQQIPPEPQPIEEKQQIVESQEKEGSDDRSQSGSSYINLSQTPIQKTVEIAVSLSEYDNANSPCKSQVSDLIESEFEVNLLRLTGKKSSLQQEVEKVVHESKFSTDESTNKMVIHSCELLEQKSEKGDKDSKDLEAEDIKDDDELSDFERVQEPEQI